MNTERSALSHEKDIQHESQPAEWRRIGSWVLVFLWAVLIFSMSARTGTDMSTGSGLFSHVYQSLIGFQERILGAGIDVVHPFAHFCEYAIFGLLLVNALSHYMSFKKACLLAILIASAYGVSDEFHQYFVPERACDPVDWLVDTLGASFGVLLFSLRRMVCSKERRS